MKQARITVEMGNDAFADDFRPELARLLREAAADVEGMEWAKAISWKRWSMRDVNGNRCAEVRIEFDDTDD